MDSFKIIAPSGASRRLVLAGAASLALAGCKPRPKAPVLAGAPAKGGPTTISDAVAGDWRLPADKLRDPWRHPVESLTWWGLNPGMTVVEFWPGTGWYTDILAPFLKDTGGKLYAANLEPTDPVATQIVDAYKARLAARPKIYGKVEVTAFGPTSGPVAPPGSADLIRPCRRRSSTRTASRCRRMSLDRATPPRRARRTA